MTVITYLVVMATAALLLSCRWRLLKKVPLVGRGLTALTRAGRRLAARVVARLRPPPPPVLDPFEVLHIQMRLHSIAHEIRQLHDDETIYARAARLKARTAAYDALLQNACDLAGVIDLADDTDPRTERELQLTARGWTW
jgi:hypothetical protein